MKQTFAFCRSLVVAIAGSLILIASGVTSAQSTQSFPVGANCSGGGQLCNNVPAIVLNVSGGPASAQFVSSSPAACSDVRIHFFVDGTEVAATGFVAPSGSSGFVGLGSLSGGTHTLGVQAEGQVGGCNSGTLGSWAGTVQVTAAFVTAAASSIPALSISNMVALSILIAMSAAGVLWWRTKL